MRYTILMVFVLLFAGIQSVNAQSCCAKGDKAAATTATEKKCDGMAKAASSTAEANQALSSVGLVPVANTASGTAKAATTAKNCDPANCDKKAHCTGTCDPSKCDHSQCDKAGAMKTSNAKAKPEKRASSM